MSGMFFLGHPIYIPRRPSWVPNISEVYFDINISIQFMNKGTFAETKMKRKPGILYKDGLQRMCPYCTNSV
jgi:hypothetical protein